MNIKKVLAGGLLILVASFGILAANSYRVAKYEREYGIRRTWRKQIPNLEKLEVLAGGEKNLGIECRAELEQNPIFIFRNGIWVYEGLGEKHYISSWEIHVNKWVYVGNNLNEPIARALTDMKDRARLEEEKKNCCKVK